MSIQLDFLSVILLVEKTRIKIFMFKSVGILFRFSFMSFLDST